MWALLQSGPMDIGAMLSQLKSERDRLETAISALEKLGGTAVKGSRSRKRRQLSASARQRIADAQRARWAAW